jgi:protein-tyrosine phosphatase
MRKSSARLKKRVYVAVFAIGSWVLVNPAFAEELEYDRVIHLKGTTNTRDIGGYQTSDQRTLLWRQIIRSENLSNLTAKDFQKLEEIGIRTVIDLRTDHELDKAPTVWLGDNPPQFYHFPVGDSQNEWFNAQRKMMQKNRFTEKQASQHMVNGYRMFAEVGQPSFQKMMGLVLDQSNWPVLIHCSAGKDRIAVAVALILEALEVDREIIMEDFMLTNEIGRSKEKAAILAKESRNSGGGRRSARGPSASAWFPIVGVKPEMMEAFYASVDEQYGSMDVFLTELGANQNARMAFAASLTTEQPELVMGK